MWSEYSRPINQVMMSKFTGTASEEDAAEWDEMLTMSGYASASGAMTSGDMAGV